MSEQVIQHPQTTIVNHAVCRAFGEIHPDAGVTEIETAVVRGVTLKIEDTEGVIRTYAFSDPIFFWIVDAILSDETRLSVSASEDPGDMSRIASVAQKMARAASEAHEIPIIDRTKGGTA